MKAARPGDAYALKHTEAGQDFLLDKQTLLKPLESDDFLPKCPHAERDVFSVFCRHYAFMFMVG